MATPDEAQLFGALPDQSIIATPVLITAMLDSGTGISDLIFSPGRPPQVERHGELRPVEVPGCSIMRAMDTAQVARDQINGNAHALRMLHEQGACDLSFALR